MRFARFFLLVALVACERSTPTAATATPTASATATATPTGAPLFTYVEAGDELSFWPPVTLRLVRKTRTCTSTLSTGNDNMWTGPDVESAFANADVQAVLRGGKVSYWPDVDDAGTITEGTLRTTKGIIEWKMRPCRFCVAPAVGVERLRKVLAGVMMNRRLLCP